MCEPRAEPNLFELRRGEAINRINPNLCALTQSRPLSHYAPLANREGVRGVSPLSGHKREAWRQR